VRLTLRNRSAAAREARRILCAHINRAVRKVRGGEVSDADIHTARKRIKNARAILQLLRRALPAAAYRSAKRSLRDAARPLSAARDAKILVEAFDALSQRCGAAGAQLAGARRLRRALAQARARARRQVAGAATGAARSRKLLRRVAAAADRWSLASGGWPGLVHGAARRYAQARASLQQVRRAPTVEKLHRWRKRAKQLCYQLELLAPLCAPALGRMAAQIRTLSDELGDDHDLAVLLAVVAAQAPGLMSAADVRTLMQLIERARARLQRSALARGARLFRLTPARFALLLRE
jgi:CHAD domain-containing protein